MEPGHRDSGQVMMILNGSLTTGTQDLTESTHGSWDLLKPEDTPPNGSLSTRLVTLPTKIPIRFTRERHPRPTRVVRKRETTVSLRGSSYILGGQWHEREGFTGLRQRCGTSTTTLPSSPPQSLSSNKKKEESRRKSLRFYFGPWYSRTD